MKMIALVLSILLIPSLTLAALPKSAAKALTQPSPQPIAQYSLDILEQKIHALESSPKNKKSVIFKAYRALSDSKWNTLSMESSRWIAQGNFVDVGYWLKAKAQKELARTALSEKKYAQSLRLSREASHSLMRVIEEHSLSPYLKLIPRELGELKVIEGNALFGLKKTREAQSSFEDGFQRLSSQDVLSTLEGDTLDHYAQSCKERESLFCRHWAEKWVRTFSKKSNEVQLLSRYFKDVVESLKSAPNYPRLTQSYKAPDLDSKAYSDALQLYWDGSFSKAAQALRQFLDEYPKSTLKTRALFWLARSLEKSGKSDDAKSIYETIEKTAGLSFHAIVACLKTQRSVDGVASALIPLGAEKDYALSASDSYFLNRAYEFLRVGAYPLAAQELKEIKSKENLSTPFLMYLILLHSKVGNSLQVFQIISELIQRGSSDVYSSFLMRRVFPIAYRDPIETQANLNGVDPILVMSLMKQESSFDARATSWVGAMGLMQIMPATAVETDSQLHISSLLKPEENIRVGSLYLKKLLERYSGNTVLALAAYNAGPTAVDRWVKNSVGKDMIEFMESIPYKETREYVSSILRNYFWYSHYIRGVFPESLDQFWVEAPTQKSERDLTK